MSNGLLVTVRVMGRQCKGRRIDTPGFVLNDENFLETKRVRSKLSIKIGSIFYLMSSFWPILIRNLSTCQIQKMMRANFMNVKMSYQFYWSRQVPKSQVEVPTM